LHRGEFVLPDFRRNIDLRLRLSHSGQFALVVFGGALRASHRAFGNAHL